MHIIRKFAGRRVRQVGVWFYTLALVSILVLGACSKKATQSSVPSATTSSPLPTVSGPAGLIVSAITDTSAVLDWTAYTGADSYNVYRGMASGFTPGAANQVGTGITLPTFADSALSGGLTYYYRITAVTAGKESPASAELAVLTRPFAPVLGPPAFTIKQVILSWAAVTGSDSYIVEADPAGSGVFTPVGTGTTNTFAGAPLAVHSANWAAAQYRAAACNTSGCSSSTAVGISTGMISAIGYFKASNTGANDSFGTKVALSGDGNTLAVGAPTEDSNAIGIDGIQANEAAADSGAVYVFGKDPVTGAWSQQAYVKASNTGFNDSFGKSVFLSGDGNTLAVGAPWEDSIATGIGGNQTDDNQLNAGAVYVFTRSGTTWSQQAYVKASNTGYQDSFGCSVALSGDGNTLAVGACYESSAATGVNDTIIGQLNDTAGLAGAVYVFTRGGTVWTQQAYVKASNTEANDRFGSSVSLSGDGNTLAVGANMEDSNATGIDSITPGQGSNTALDSGAAYVFTRSGTTWSQQAYVKASNTEASDFFGTSVALNWDGTTLAVGADGEDSAATGINSITPGQGSNTALESGAAYVFTRSTGTWSQQAYVKASNTGAGDNFGNSVFLSGDGNTLAVAAPGEDSTATGINGGNNNFTPGSGAAYVFTRSLGIWSQQAFVKAPTTGVSNNFGYSISLSADSGTLAVGACYENSSATGVGGNQADTAATGAGAAYLY